MTPRAEINPPPIAAISERIAPAPAARLIRSFVEAEGPETVGVGAGDLDGLDFLTLQFRRGACARLGCRVEKQLSKYNQSSKVQLVASPISRQEFVEDAVAERVFRGHMSGAWAMVSQRLMGCNSYHDR